MTFVPLLEIIFYIAVLFAPMDTARISITEGQDSIIYSRTADGWKSAADGAIWKLDGFTVLHGEDSIDVSAFVKGADTHNWSEESILKLSGNMEILKTSDGCRIYPNGIDSPNNKWEIKYIEQSGK